MKKQQKIKAWTLSFVYLVFGLAWVIGSDWLLAWSFGARVGDLLFGGTLKGIVFVLLSTVFMQVAAMHGNETVQADRPGDSRPRLWRPVAAIMVATLLITVAASVVFQRQLDRVRHDAEIHLRDSAALKAAHVVAWYENQLAAGNMVALSPFTGPAVQQWLDHPTPERKRALERRLDALRLSQKFQAVRLFTPSGRQLALSDARRSADPDDELLRTVAAAVAQRHALLTSLRHLRETDSIGLDMVAPLLGGPDPDAPVVAVLVATTDARSLLAGLGEPATAGARSGSVAMLARRLGDHYQYVTSSALPGERPGAPRFVESPTLPNGVRLADSGAGIPAAIPSHDEPTISVSAPAHGTPWQVVAMHDLQDLHATVLRLQLEVAGLALLGIAVACLLVLNWWRAERQRSLLDLQRSTARAEEAQARLDWLSNSANDAVLLMDSTGAILDVNGRAIEWYGYPRDEFLTRNVADLREPDPESPAKLDRQLRQALQTGSLVFEVTHVRKGGATFPVEVSTRRFERDGRTLLQSTVRDITERRQHVDRLRASEARYRALFEAVPHPMCVHDAATNRIALVNAAAIRLYGYSREEFLELSVADLIHPDDAASMQRYLAGGLETGSAEVGTWRTRTRDGRTIHVDAVSHGVEFDGRPGRIVLASDVTERLMAEGRLRESEERYRDLFESNPNPMWAYDTDTLRFLMVNRAAVAHYGYSEAEFLAMTIADIRPHEDQARLRANVAMHHDQVLQNSGVWQHRTRDGRLLDVEIRSHSLDIQGRKARVVLAHDVTETLASNRRIRRQRDLFDMLAQSNQAMMRVDDASALFATVTRLAVERGHFRLAWIGELSGGGVLPVAQWGIDDGHLVEVRDGIRDGRPVSGGAFAAVLGSGRAEVVDDTATDARPFVSVLASRFGILSAAAVPVRSAGRVTHGLVLYSGERGFFDAETVRTLEEMAADLSFGIDILATRRALDENRQLLQSIIDASDTLIYAFDLEGRALFVNAACARVLGTTPVAAVGKRRADLATSPTSGIYGANDDVVVRSGELAVFEEAGPDGRTVYLSTKFPLRDVAGRIYGVGGVSTDITDLRRMQAELADANVVLERRVEERTRDLAAARDRAEAADRAKSAFLASISHELRSPLHSITGFTSVLLEGIDGALNEAQSEHLAIVRDSSQHLLRIVNDLIDISRLQSGGMSIEARPYRPQDVLERLEQRYRPQAEGRGLEFRFGCALDGSSLLGDERRVEQVIGNLLSNAIKFTATGSVTLAARLDGAKLRVDVIDTGRGIAGNDLGKLFTRFSQLDPGTGMLTEGTGLGLAIAQGLARAMGGELAVESEPGRGSTFSLILAVERADREDTRTLRPT